MIVEIECDGRRHAVDVQRQGDLWLVTIDGRRIAARVADIGGRWSLLIDGAGPADAGRHAGGDVASGLSQTQDAGSGLRRSWRSYEVGFEARGGGAYVVHVDGEPVPLSIADPRGLRAFRRGGSAAGQGGGASAVVAPMPGRVVKVLVRPGDVVAARQGVVVVEAMKMENELRAAQAGTVRDVRVTEGMSVERDAVLVVLE